MFYITIYNTHSIACTDVPLVTLVTIFFFVFSTFIFVRFKTFSEHLAVERLIVVLYNRYLYVYLTFCLDCCFYCWKHISHKPV